MLWRLIREEAYFIFSLKRGLIRGGGVLFERGLNREITLCSVTNFTYEVLFCKF